VTSPDYHGLLADVAAENAALDAILVGLDPDAWATPTPALGWDVRDSVAHLAFSEDLAQLALRDPTAYIERRDALLTADDDTLILGDGSLSAMSFATARLMETWAHGQDIRDALGLAAEVSPRLLHVADLGVRSRRFAYEARGREPNTTPVFVELTGPDGARWTWGDPADDTVRGPAVDFCLVVTQRIHPADTDLVVDGDAAAEWIGIAQAFAGSPTEQRPRRSD